MNAKLQNISNFSNKNKDESNKKVLVAAICKFWKQIPFFFLKLFRPISALIYLMFFNIKTKSLKFVIVKGAFVLLLVYWLQAKEIKFHVTYGDQNDEIVDDGSLAMKKEKPSFNKLAASVDAKKEQDTQPKVVLTSSKNPMAPAEVKDLKKNDVELYIERFEKVARMEMKKYGIPASIKLAQGIIESRSGKSKLAKSNNNHFGMKCFSKNCVKGHCSNHNDDHHKDFFRQYNTAWESWRAHSKLLAGSKRYKSLFLSNDYNKWAKGLSELGYATDKNYEKKLKSIIKKYNLHKYDNQ